MPNYGSPATQFHELDRTERARGRRPEKYLVHRQLWRDLAQELGMIGRHLPEPAFQGGFFWRGARVEPQDEGWPGLVNVVSRHEMSLYSPAVMTPYDVRWSWCRKHRRCPTS
jgi:hypothetical protein